MEELFGREWAERGGGLRFWLRQCWDHAAAALAVRRRRRREDGMMAGFLEEMPSTVRGLRRAPTFTVFAVVTLALGVSATATALTVLDRVVLRPLPYPDSDRLFVVGSDFEHDPGGVGPLSIDQIVTLLDDPSPADAVTGVSSATATVMGLGDPERLVVHEVGERFFELLGATPAVGRLLGEPDQAAGAARTAVLDHAFWLERFGGDPDVLGRALRIDDESHEVVGVLAADFVPPEGVADGGPLWTAAGFRAGRADASSFSIRGLARLPRGISADLLDERFDERFRDVHDFLLGATIVGQREHVVGEIAGRVGSAVGGVVLLLLIACVNVASLMLARARSRARELTVRVTLGAGRGRLLRQLLGEAGVLAMAGGVLGGVLTVWSVELFRSTAPQGIPRLTELTVDATGLASIVMISVFAMMAAGVGPALSATASAHAGRSGPSRSATPGRRDARVRAGLVTLETALAVVLVVASGLLANDLVRLTVEDRGFDGEGLTSMRVDLGGGDVGDGNIGFWSELLASARSLPGIAAAELVSRLPYDGVSEMRSLEPEGAGEEHFVVVVAITPGYFELLSISIQEGRGLLPSEAASATRAVVVNEAFVRRFWPGDGAVGRDIVIGRTMDRPGVSYSVVGVAADLRVRPGTAAPPQVFFGVSDPPGRQRPRPRMELVVKSESPEGVAVPLRALLRRLRPDLPIGRIAQVDAVAAGTLDRPRFYAGLFGGFAALALLLALVGVYGTTAYATRSRTREIGIRMALGAVRRSVVRDILASTAGVLTGGVVLGLAVAALASRAMSEVLLYVTPRDLGTYAAVGVGVLLTGVLAAAQPALRSTHLDPAATLREE